MNENKITSAKHKSSAFTWIEWLVIISILALLIGILLPSLGGSHHHRPSKSVVDLSNLRQIGAVMVVYANDHDDWLPTHPRDAKQYLDDESYDSRGMWLNPYQGDDAVIDRGDFDGVATRFGGYVFINLGENIDEIMEPTKTILAYTAKVSEKQTTRGVQFVDGHVESWEEEKLRAVLPKGVDVDALDGP